MRVAHAWGATGFEAAAALAASPGHEVVSARAAECLALAREWMVDAALKASATSA
jgi:hypothetical protein